MSPHCGEFEIVWYNKFSMSNCHHVPSAYIGISLPHRGEFDKPKGGSGAIHWQMQNRYAYNNSNL